jgi:hypothetical protein
MISDGRSDADGEVLVTCVRREPAANRPSVEKPCSLQDSRICESASSRDTRSPDLVGNVNDTQAAAGEHAVRVLSHAAAPPRGRRALTSLGMLSQLDPDPIESA